MNLVDFLHASLHSVGTEWVIWLMLGLSLVSVVIIERGWFYWSRVIEILDLLKREKVQRIAFAVSPTTDAKDLDVQ